MSNVGEFVVKLRGDTSGFDKPFSESAKKAESFNKAVGISTILADAQAASMARATTVNTAYSGATSFAGAASFGLAAAAKNANGPMANLRETMEGVTQSAISSTASFAANTAELSDMQRTANQASEQNKKLDRSLKSVSAQADLQSGRIGLLAYFWRAKLSTALTEVEVGLLHAARNGGGIFSKFLTGAAQLTIGFDRVTRNLSTGFTALSLGITKGAGAFRNWLVNLQPATSVLGKIRIHTDAFTNYLKGVFGPVLSDIGVVAKYAWRAFSFAANLGYESILLVGRGFAKLGPQIQFQKDLLIGFGKVMLGVLPKLASMTADWVKGLFDVTKNGAKLGSIPAFFLAAGIAIGKLAGKIPGLTRAFSAVSSAFVWTGGAMISIINAAKKLGPALVFQKNLVIGFGKVMAGVGKEFLKFGAIGIKSVWEGLKSLKPVLTFISNAASMVGKAFVAALPYLSSFAKGMGYVLRETAKGIATVVRMGGALAVGVGFLAKWAAAAASAAAKATIFGLSILKNAGFVGGLAIKLGLLGLSFTGVGAPIAAVLGKVQLLVTAIPMVGKVFSGLQSVIGGVSKAIGFLVGKFAMIATVGFGGILAAAGGLALLTKAGFSAGGAAAKLADKIGVSTQSLIGLQHAAKMSGVDGFDEKLKGLNASLQSAKADSPLAKSLSAAGLSLEQLRSQAPDQALNSIADAMQNMGSHADRVRLSTQLFGDQGQRMAMMLKDGSAGLAGAGKDAEKLGLSMSRVDVGIIEQANVAVGRLKELFLGVGRQIAVQVAPFVEALAVKMVSFGTQGEGAAGIVSTGFSFAGKAMTFLLDTVDGGINLFYQSKQAVLDFAAAGTSGLASFLSGADWMASWIDYGIVGFKALGVGIMTMFAGIFDGIGQLVSILPSLPEWLGGGRIIDPKLFTGIGDSFRKTAAELQNNLNNHESFSFDGMREGLDKASKAMLTNSAETGKILQERLAGPKFSERVGQGISSILKDAKSRAQDTAKLAAEGSKGVLAAATEEADKKNKELKSTIAEMSGGSALIRGSVEDADADARSRSQTLNVAQKTQVVQNMERAKADVANRTSKSDVEAPKQTNVLNQILVAIRSPQQGGGGITLEPGVI